MSIKNLFYWSYWFSQPYIARGWEFTVWLWGFLVLALLGIVALIARSLKTDAATRRILGRFAACGILMGLLGLVWFWLRQERVLFLAWRFWLILWLAVFVGWFGKLVWYVFWRLPEIRLLNAERAAKEKYLPT